MEEAVRNAKVQGVAPLTWGWFVITFCASGVCFCFTPSNWPLLFPETNPEKVSLSVYDRTQSQSGTQTNPSGFYDALVALHFSLHQKPKKVMNNTENADSVRGKETKKRSSFFPLSYFMTQMPW